VRLRRGQVTAGRLRIVPVEGDLRGDAQLAAGDERILQVFRHDRDLGQRIAPPAGLIQNLAQDAQGLRQSERRTDPVGEFPRPLRGGQRLLPPVNAGERDSLVDLQQQAEVLQGRVSLGNG